jgi:hypothetical protein
VDGVDSPMGKTQRERKVKNGVTLIEEGCVRGWCLAQGGGEGGGVEGVEAAEEGICDDSGAGIRCLGSEFA